MYEPSKAQETIAEELALAYDRSTVERLPDSTNVVICGYTDGCPDPHEMLLVAEDGARLPAFRPVQLFGGVFAVRQGRDEVRDSQTVFYEGAVAEARGLNASFA